MFSKISAIYKTCHSGIIKILPTKSAGWLKYHEKVGTKFIL
jgi:hypothetical protein